MRNRIGLLLAPALALVLGLGCGSIGEILQEQTQSNSNQTSSDKSGSANEKGKSESQKKDQADTKGDETKIPECVAVVDRLAELSGANDDPASRIAKEALYGLIRDQIKENIEKNVNNPKAAAEFCKQLQKQIELGTK